VCGSKQLPKGQPCPQTKDGSSPNTTHTVKNKEENYTMYKVTATSVKPVVVTVSINNASLEMEVNTGASVFIISEETYNCLWFQAQASPLQESSVKLKTYGGEQIHVRDSTTVIVTYKEQTE